MNKQPLRYSIGSVIACLVVSLLLSSGGAFSTGQAAILVVTKTRIPTSQPTLTATPTALTQALKKQLYYTGLGGGQVESCTPEILSQFDDLPALAYTGWQIERTRFPKNPIYIISLCVFGIPFSDGFTLTLIRPDGSRASQATYRLTGESDPNNRAILEQIDQTGERLSAIGDDTSEAPILEINVWLPLGLAPGKWRARIAAADVSFEETFQVPPAAYLPLVSLDKSIPYLFPLADSLRKPQAPYGNSNAMDCPAKKSSDPVKLFGAALPPKSKASLGLYTDLGDFQFTLVAQSQVQANAQGEWSTSRTIQPSEQPGVYWWLLVTDPSAEEISTAGPGMCYEIESWQPCPGVHSSSLKPGDTVQIAKLPQSLDHLRANAHRDSKSLAQVRVGQKFTIEGGPTCQGKWVWWQLRTTGGEQGWFPEREKNVVWLVKSKP